MEGRQFTTREAAKGVLYVPDGRIIVVAGKRGMFNLPGGGLDAGEMPQEAFIREVREELNLSEVDMTNVHAVGSTWGIVTPEYGVSRRAIWHVFESDVSVEPGEIKYGEEITDLDYLTVEEIKQHTNMSNLAKQAMNLVKTQSNSIRGDNLFEN